MAIITITLSAADLIRVVTALSMRWGYQAILPDTGILNPQTPGEFVRMRLAKYIREETREHELSVARQSIAVAEVVIT